MGISTNLETDSVTSLIVNDSFISHVDDEDEDLPQETYKFVSKWYSIAILVLALLGLAINLTAVIILRKKKGIFHTMLKVNFDFLFYFYFLI